MKKTTVETLNKAAQDAGLRWMVSGASIGIYVELPGGGLEPMAAFEDPKQAEAYMRGYKDGKK